MTITVSLPYYRTPDTVREAVLSILTQTYRDLILIVVNDGDGPGCWRPLQGIHDPRFVRFDLPENMGRYFCDAVTLRACKTEFWTPHDSDDWSEPERLSRLMEAMTPETEVVFGGYTQHRQNGSTNEKLPTLEKMVGSDTLQHVAHHTGLYRTESLRKIGGPNPDFRVAWDTFQVGVAVNRLRWRSIPDALYHYRQRRDSLVNNPETGMRSPYRLDLREKLAESWRDFIRCGRLPRPESTRKVLLEAERLRGEL